MKDTHKHYIGKITLKAIIEKDGKILICRGGGDDTWEFPGGRLNEGESPEEGVIREVKEELGLTVGIEKIVYACRSFQAKANIWQVLIAYECSLDGSDNIKMDLEEITDVRWVSKEELKEVAIYDDCSQVIDKYLCQT